MLSFHLRLDLLPSDLFSYGFAAYPTNSPISVHLIFPYLSTLNVGWRIRNVKLLINPRIRQ